MRHSGIYVILHVCSFFNPSTYASSDIIISLHLLSIFSTITDKTSLIENKTISFQTCLVSSYYLLVEGNRYVRRNRKNLKLDLPICTFFYQNHVCIACGLLVNRNNQTMGVGIIKISHLAIRTPASSADPHNERVNIK